MARPLDQLLVIVIWIATDLNEQGEGANPPLAPSPFRRVFGLFAKICWHSDLPNRKRNKQSRSGSSLADFRQG